MSARADRPTTVRTVRGENSAPFPLGISSRRSTRLDGRPAPGEWVNEKKKKRGNGDTTMMYSRDANFSFFFAFHTINFNYLSYNCETPITARACSLRSEGLRSSALQKVTRIRVTFLRVMWVHWATVRHAYSVATSTIPYSPSVLSWTKGACEISTCSDIAGNGRKRARAIRPRQKSG